MWKWLDTGNEKYVPGGTHWINEWMLIIYQRSHPWSHGRPENHHGLCDSFFCALQCTFRLLGARALPYFAFMSLQSLQRVKKRRCSRQPIFRGSIQRSKTASTVESPQKQKSNGSESGPSVPINLPAGVQLKKMSCCWDDCNEDFEGNILLARHMKDEHLGTASGHTCLWRGYSFSFWWPTDTDVHSFNDCSWTACYFKPRTDNSPWPTQV